MRLYRLLICVLLVLMAATVVRAQEEHEHTELTEETEGLLHDVRGETAPYADLDTALEAGYGKFLECFTNGTEAGMGQHYVNGEYAGDDVLDALKPEALVYEPREDGGQILVAFEYLVFADVWDPENEGREAPTLFGQEFHLKTNIPDTPPVWTLHLWLWAHNPDGLFTDYNPLIACPEDAPTVDMSAQ